MAARRTRHLKVLDFGLAKEMDAASAGDPTLTSAARTALGAVMGTPAYMSPEQVQVHERPLDLQQSSTHSQPPARRWTAAFRATAPEPPEPAIHRAIARRTSHQTVPIRQACQRRVNRHLRTPNGAHIQWTVHAPTHRRVGLR